MNAPLFVHRSRVGTGLKVGLGVGLLAPTAVRSLATALLPGPRDVVPVARLVVRATGRVLRGAGALLRAGDGVPAAPDRAQPTADHPPTRAAA